MALVGARAREVVVRAQVVGWAREVSGLAAQRPAREARCPQPRAAMEPWAGREAPDRAARLDLDRAA